jgi:hypothetical protein
MRRKPSHKRRKNQKLVCLTRKNAKTVELFHHLFFTNVHFCAVTILAAKFHRLGPCHVDLFSHFLGCLHRFSVKTKTMRRLTKEKICLKFTPAITAT